MKKILIFFGLVFVFLTLCYTITISFHLINQSGIFSLIGGLILFMFQIWGIISLANYTYGLIKGWYKNYQESQNTEPKVE